MSLGLAFTVFGRGMPKLLIQVVLPGSGAIISYTTMREFT